MMRIKQTPKSSGSAILALFVFCSHPVYAGCEDTERKPVPNPTVIPMPCEASLIHFYKDSNNHWTKPRPGASPDPGNPLASFGRCREYPVANPPPAGGESETYDAAIPDEQSAKGYVNRSVDWIIKGIVENRIHNLYLGFNSLDKGPPTSWSDPMWVRDSSTLTSQGYGPCSSTGACNQYAGEGYSSTWGITFAIDKLGLASPAPSPLPTPTPGDHGYIPGTANNLFTGLDKHVGGDGSSVLNSDFYATGVTAANAPRATPEGGVVPAVSPVPTSLPNANSVDAQGWPSQFLGASSRTTGCNENPPAGQSDIGLHTAHCMHDAQHYHLRTLTWPGPTPSATPTGTRSCDYEYAADFSQATTLASLENGAMVQATWNALNEVVKEIKAYPYQLKLSAACQPWGAHYVKELNGSAEELYCSHQSNSHRRWKTYRDELRDFLSTCNADPTGDIPHIGNCHRASLLNDLRSTSFVKAAQCEVLSRAQHKMDQAFRGNGALWIQQLQRWSSASCMLATGTLFDAQHGAGTAWGVEHNAHVCVEAACAWSHLFPPLMPYCYMAAIGTVYCPAVTDRCVISNQGPGQSCTNQIAADFKLNYLGSSSTKMGNCLPYAYATALKTYLDKLGFAPPADSIQFSYESKQPGRIPVVGAAPRPGARPPEPLKLLTITNGKITDNTPSPIYSPAPRPVPTGNR